MFTSTIMYLLKERTTDSTLSHSPSSFFNILFNTIIAHLDILSPALSSFFFFTCFQNGWKHNGGFVLCSRITTKEEVLNNRALPIFMENLPSRWTISFSWKIWCYTAFLKLLSIPRSDNAASSLHQHLDPLWNSRLNSIELNPRDGCVSNFPW